MVIGERQRKRVSAPALVLAGLAALCIAMLLPGAEGPPPTREWQLCDGPHGCRAVDISRLTLHDGVRELTTVYAAPEGARDPLAIHITGMASAEVRWNGVVIGRNGIVGGTPATETPGRFDARIGVPRSLIRTGPNHVVVRLSAQHLWAPVARPIHWLSVDTAAPDSAHVFVHYLPTLILLGVLLVALLANLGLWAARRTAQDAVLSGLAAAVLLQAVIETSKLAMAYLYPWQLARLFAVATLATLTALLLVRAGLGWMPDRSARRVLLAGALTGCAAAWLLFPWWDAKAVWAIRAGLGATLIAAATGASKGTHLAMAASLACIAALGMSGMPGFLDFGYYLLFAGLFAAHIVLGARSFYEVERVPFASLPASQPDTEVILVPDGGAQLRVAVNDILYAQADDDYSIIHLRDGRELLATMNLAALLRLAPERLLRVHRSHAINPDRIKALHRAGKLARTVELVGGSRLRVGRTYWESVAARLSGAHDVRSERMLGREAGEPSGARDII